MDVWVYNKLRINEKKITLQLPNKPYETTKIPY
jgi:hypothetical protein